MLKTFRDIRETIGSFISITVVIFIGCFFFAGITSGSNAVTKQVDDYYAASRYATAYAEYMYVNSTAVDEIAATEGVEAAEGYNSFNTRVTLGGIRYDMNIATLTDGIDVPTVLSGRLPEARKNELIVDTVFAEKHGLGIGDELSFSINTLNKITLLSSVMGTDENTAQYFPEYESVDYKFAVCGIYHSPDVIYKVNTLNTAAQPDEFIFALVNYGDIAAYKDGATVVTKDPNGAEIPLFAYSLIPDTVNVYNGIKVISDGKIEADKLFGRYSLSSMDEITDMFTHADSAAGLYMYSLERSGFPTVTAFDSINDTIASLAAILPFMFFAVAAVITVISLSKTVDNQRMQIGVIQALGIGKGTVYFSYIFYALFACVIGGISGGVVGILLIPYLINILYARQFSMPPTSGHVSVLFLILGVVVAAALASLAAFASCHHTLRVKPAQAMRPKPPKKTRRILAERWTWLWRRLGFGAKMNLRNMFLHKIRMLLSSVGIIGCLALLIGLIGLKDNMAFSFEQYDASVGYDLTVITDTAVSLDVFDFDEISDYRGAEYIGGLTFVPDFSGRFEFGGKVADMTVMALPTARDAQERRYTDADCVRLSDDKRGKHRLDLKDDTFAIPNTLADKLGVKVGDKVTVSGYSLDNRSVAFDVEITDIIYEYFELKAYTSYRMFGDCGVGLFADTIYAKVADGVSLGTAIAELKSYAEVRDVKSFGESYAALEKQMSMLDYAVILFVVGAAALAVAVIYNITATNLKERTREIATLMVLGYKPRETANMLIVENMVITGLGCVLGLPLGYGMLIWLVNLTTSFNVFISSFFSWYVAVGCILLTFAFSLAATLILGRRMKNISMVEALKSVE